MPSFTVPPDSQTALLCGHCGDALTDDAETFATDTYGDVCEPCRDELPGCANCNDIDGPFEEDIDGNDNCRSCTRSLYGYITCADCGRPGRYWDLNSSDNGEVCADCRSERYWECVVCDYLISTGTYCETCESEQDEESDYVHSYSYRPVPRFHGDGPAYLGFELEITTPRHDLDDIARHTAERLGFGDLGYLKEDSSIGSAGFEIVTHPMSHAWASRHFPWELLEELRGQGCGAETDDDGLGLHVHVSRAGFSDADHAERWLTLIYDNSDKVDAVARRRSGEWAAWDTTEKKSRIKDYAKGEAAGRRYSAVNCQNTHTFEIRVFKSTLNRAELRAALDLVAASVEYTRVATTPTWDEFAAYVAVEDAYAALSTMLTNAEA